MGKSRKKDKIGKLCKHGVCFVFIVLWFCSCTKNRRLDIALEFAGNNRVELEKVLEYYKDSGEKYNAARFLIENMPHYFSYEGWQLDSIKQIFSANDFSPKKTEKWKHFSFNTLRRVYDVHVITAEYLIENIELSFDVWKKRKWNNTLEFDDFCEYILPYRIADEPISSWRKLYHDYYASILDSLYDGSDVVEACRIVDAKLKAKGYRYNTDLRIPHIDGAFLFYHRIGYCREVCDLTVYAMRACGIPVSTEFFVYAPDYQHSHSWNTLRDTTGLFIQFNFNEFEPTREVIRTDGRKKGKVFRYCFGRQTERFPQLEGNDEVPTLFKNNYIKDVTINYVGENNVTVPLQSKKGEYVYLGVFSPTDWIPIDMTLRNDDLASFQNIEPNIIYQPLYSNGSKHYPAGYPFIYTDGITEVLEPNIEKMEKVTLFRKMSTKPTISEWSHRGIIGSRIEASNTPTFKKTDLLYSFKDTLRTNYYELTPLIIDTKYKYVRYFSPNRMELAEFSIYTDSLRENQIPLRRINDIDPVENLDNITDGNILTYFQAEDSATFIAYDLGEATSIGKIVFSPRNDDNYIWVGDRYELFYQDGINGWKSLGVKTALEQKIEFYAPQRALLWLRNLTKGREEQIFVYREGKQIFTIDL